MPFDEFLDHLVDCLKREFDDALNWLPYDSETGALWGVLPVDELLEASGEITVCEGLRRDIESILSEQQWHRPMSGDEFLAEDWLSFRHQVKHRHRYFFMQVGPQVYRFGEDDDPSARQEHILDAIARLVQSEDLIRTLPEGASIFRARAAKRGEEWRTEEDLGSPPPARATSGRMNAAGISVFYGSEGPETTIAEIENRGSDQSDIWSARWTLTRPLRILDLVDLPAVPSLFGDAWRKRGPLAFLHGFAKDVSGLVPPPVDPKADPIDYVPTQIVTEYFRYVFQCGDGGIVDGIRFRSARSRGVNVTLLPGREVLIGCGRRVIANEPILRLDKGSIGRFPPST